MSKAYSTKSIFPQLVKFGVVVLWPQVGAAFSFEHSDPMNKKLISTAAASACRTMLLLPEWIVSRRACTQYIALAIAYIVIAVVGASGVSAQDTKAAAPGKMLIFRNIPSWDRSPDFEDASRTLKLSFEVKKSSEMKNTRLSDYSVIVIPGAQWDTGYYADFARSATAFDQYVQSGGVLLLELNGAEGEGITLPGGPSMVRHAGFDNLIVMPAHPAVSPLAQKPRITANLASHGYLQNVPENALVIATVTADGRTPDKAKPTYVEYSHGKGRIIAACQCFHDRDESGRGPLMPAALSYAMTGKWYSTK